jgi:hypothetical protein
MTLFGISGSVSWDSKGIKEAENQKLEDVKKGNSMRLWGSNYEI